MNQTEIKGTYTYRQSPVLNRSWMIYNKDASGGLSPVGDYTVLDADEDLLISEKKVMNLISLLNGEDELMELGAHTQSRLLFHRKPRSDEADPQQVIFYTYSGAGMSRENAILTLQAGVSV